MAQMESADDLRKRIQLVQSISQEHPSLGVSRGWSCYLGEKIDSGQWFSHEMLRTPIHELELFQNEIDEEKKKSLTTHTGRHDDPTILYCICGWYGMRKDAKHGYKKEDEFETECVDFCPNCNTEI